MVQITIISLFPEFLSQIANYSVVQRAIAKNKLNLNFIDLHQFGIGARHQIDDYQYGGGAGMVIMAPPLIKAIEKVKAQQGGKVIFFTPQGRQLNQKTVIQLVDHDESLILVCGHFEGVDQRVRSYFDLELSIGDYVLSGGELPAMILINAISRLIPGVIKLESTVQESFTNQELDHPTYTRPISFRHRKVPPVLTSGNHQVIKKWRAAARAVKTKIRRPDLKKNKN